MPVLLPGVAERLLAAISEARWFAGKGRPAELREVTPLPWLTPPGQWPAVRLEVLEVGYPNDGPDAYELYQLAISYYPTEQPELAGAETVRAELPDLGAVIGYDAAQDPAGAATLLAGLLGGSRTAGPGGEVRFHLTENHRLQPDLQPRMFRGQQSNTSIMFGDVAMVKLFRRLELGHNLDIQVHDALGRAGIRDVATLYGWIDGTWPHRGVPVQADLALVVEKLAAAEDGWGLALESLRAGRSFATEAATLGSALAEIHAGLAAAFGTSEAVGSATAAVMSGRLATAAAIAPALGPHVAGLDACFRDLGNGTLTTQRVHGDFHLGQTLHTPDGWKIIDFEGEPAKSLAERQAFDSPWRDIAGMLRSFDYAGASVSGPHSASWVLACRDAFLTAYAGGHVSDADAGILRAYEADKAIYEVVYEVRNRPDWVAIPLGALAELAAPQPVHDHPAVHDDPAATSAAGEKE